MIKVVHISWLRLVYNATMILVVCVLSTLQGALHVMLLPSIMSVYVHDWALMTSTLPALVVVCSLFFANCFDCIQ